MTRTGSDGRIKRNAADAIDETQNTENGRAESWQAGPSTTRVSMPYYSRESHKATDRSRIATQPTAAQNRNIPAEIVILLANSVTAETQPAETTPYTYTNTLLPKSIIRNTKYDLSYCCVCVCGVVGVAA